MNTTSAPASTSGSAALEGSCVDWTEFLRRTAADGRPVDAVPPTRRARTDRELLACAAVAVGSGQRALVMARDRAAGRVVAGHPLLELQSTGHRLARAAARLAVARAHLAVACRDEDDRPEDAAPSPAAPASVAAAAEAASACAWVLVQVFGAAGTSAAAPTAAFESCRRAAAAAGPPAELWLEAGRRRSAGPSGGAA